MLLKHLPEGQSMTTVVEAPLTMVEAVAALRLPPKSDQRLQVLMDRNTDGALRTEEKEELEALVELSETIALVRAQAAPCPGPETRMRSRSETTRSVEARAEGRCEYCRMHQSLQGATFHVEHITPSSRGGPSEPANLAWCCPACNLHKSDRIEANDPTSGDRVLLFNPRRDHWPAHFRWEGYHLTGQTSVGRATVLMLDLNHPRRFLIRQAEEIFGLFPP